MRHMTKPPEAAVILHQGACFLLSDQRQTFVGLYGKLLGNPDIVVVAQKNPGIGRAHRGRLHSVGAWQGCPGDLPAFGKE